MDKPLCIPNGAPDTAATKQELGTSDDRSTIQEAEADDEDQSGSSSDEAALSEGDGWDDWQEDNKTPTYSLITPAVLFPSTEQAIQHDMHKHGFCIRSLMKRLHLDSSGRIKLINWIRAGQQHARSKDELDALTGEESWLVEQSAQWFIPRISEDGMLQYDFEDEEDEWLPRTQASDSAVQFARHETQSGGLPASEETSSQMQIDQLCTELSRLQQENSRTRQLLGHASSLLEKDHKTVLQSTKRSGFGLPREEARDDDTHYFSSYAHEGIHWTMIQDEVRTDSYLHFISSSPYLFRDKRVLDIGCGTGILSFFAARAGAKKVYAIDASQIAKNASANMKANGISGTVKVINKKVEDLDLEGDLDNEKVDVVVSEWMGYACLYEVFLPSVLIARDRFLKPRSSGGLMAPSQCSIFMAGWGDESWWEEKVAWWDTNKYGFKMRESMTERMFKEGLIEDFPPRGIITSSMCLRDVLTTTMSSNVRKCISFTQSFTIRVSSQQMGTCQKFHGFLIWFDTFFTADGRAVDSRALEDNKEWKLNEAEVGFSTSARATSTHWHQTLLLVKQPFVVDNDTEIDGTSTWKVQPDNGRELEISMMWRVRPTTRSDWGPYCAQIWKV